MINKMQIPVFFIILLYFLILPGALFPAPTLITHDKEESYNLNTYLEYYEDTEGTVSIDEIASSGFNDKFITNENAILNLGFTDSTCWIRCTILYSGKEEDRQETEWMLEVDYPQLDYITLYLPRPEGEWDDIITGDCLPFKNRPVLFHNFVFKIPLKSNTPKTIYLSVKSAGSLQAPLTLRSEAGMRKKINNKQIAMGILYGIMIVMVLYNLFIFFSIRERAYLFYVIYIFLTILMHVSLYGHAFQYLWPESPGWGNRSILFFMGIVSFAAFLFSREYLQTKKLFPVMNKIFIISMLYLAVISIVSFFLPYGVSVKIAAGSAPLTAFIILISGILALKKGYKSARFFLTAWIFVIIGAILNPLSMAGIFPLNFVAYNGPLLGASLEVVLLSFALADRINIINHEKKKAQEKYRSLVEGSTDIIFTLDDQFRFLSVNKAVKAALNIIPESVLSKEFTGILFEETNRRAMTKQFVRQQLDLFAKEKSPISFKTRFKLPIHSEFKEMQVHLEYIDIEGKHEILGKAWSISEDIFLNYFISEQQKMLIGNFIYVLDEITFRLTRNINKYIDPAEANLVRIGLREILLNAIEHGNLGISYDEKTEALLGDNYFTLLANRQNDGSKKDRKVNIDFKIDEDTAEYTITDEGAGFNHKEIMNYDVSDRNVSLETHGRGLTMAQEIFDSIEFNEKGNRVVLVKKLRPHIETQ
ncbi:MAG: PAS domain-containing protein [bacterium]|nr:PAS domain-containing protein [bacterium]